MRPMQRNAIRLQKELPMTFVRTFRWPAALAALIFIVMTTALFLPGLHPHAHDSETLAGLNPAAKDHECPFCELIAAFRNATTATAPAAIHQGSSAGFLEIGPEDPPDPFRYFLIPARAPPSF